MKSHLRLSGALATVVFLVMVASDLLMLTTLDFSQPYRFWRDAPGLPQTQVALGYYLGELTIPFYCVGAWHLSLAARPAGRWASWLVLFATAYGASLLTVWHASFAFNRSILRAEIGAGAPAGGPTPEALLAFEAYAVPLFRVALAVAVVESLVVLGLILLGKTLYPRWAGLALPVVFAVTAVLLETHVPVWASVVLGAGGWNAGGAATFAVSTIVLWNRGS